jgi:hypothetical protein
MKPLNIAPIAAAVLLLAGCGQSKDAPVAKGDAIAAIPAPAGKPWAEQIVATPEGGVRMGNPDAPVKLVEYGSLTCPHCAKLAEEGFAKLSGDYVASGRVSFEFRSYVIHPQDVPLTMLAQCGPVETFFPLVEQVFANMEAMQAPLSDPAVQQRANAALQGPPEQRMTGLADALGFIDFFSARGLPVDQARACLADGTKANQISAQGQKWLAEGIDSTPSLFLNGAKLNTAEWSAVDAALKEAGAR